MILIIKNTTSSLVRVEDTGQVIPANGQRKLDPRDYCLYQSSALNSVSFQKKIASQDIVINVDTEDLTADEGQRFLETLSNLTLQIDGVTLERAITAINLQNPNSVTVSGGTANIDLSPAIGNVTGSVISFVFLENGEAENEWLNNSEDGINSDGTPCLIPFNCQLIGITFENSYNGADVELEIWKASAGLGNWTNVFTVSENNVRYFYNRTVQNSNITFSIGDKLAVFSGGCGTTDDVVVRVWLQITSSPAQNATDNNNTRPC